MPDASIGSSAQRRLAAILAADIAGYSRLIGEDEAGTVSRLKQHQAVILPMAAQFGGSIIDTAGDGLLAEFPSAVRAVECAVSILKAMSALDRDVPADRRMVFRIGINLGDVIYDEKRIYGDGVNIAARLESLAQPGEIFVSEDVYRNVRGRIDTDFDDLGEYGLKNIVHPVHVYRLRTAGTEDGARGPAIPVQAETPSLAVLPFQNIGADPEQEYFADGVVEDIITALSRVRWLFVIARNSSFVYKGKSIDARRIGRELGVRYLLEGSIRRAGSRVRISGQLVEAATGRHIWAARFDGDLSDIFELQDRITTSVLVAVEPSLRLAEIQRAQKKPTERLDAYDLYLRALPWIAAYTKEGFVAAEELLRRALDLDPNYADALAALAECLVRMTLNGWVADKQASTNAACDMAARAVAADPENAPVLAIAAWAYSTLGIRFEQSLELANRALGLHPNSVHVRSFCGWVFNYFGESTRAIEQFEEARRLSPVDPKSYFPLLGLAAAHFFAENFEECVQLCGRILAEVPTHNVARRYLAAALGQLGRIDEAKAVIGDLLKSQPQSSLRSARSSGFRNPRMAELYVGGLQRAGLPE